MTMLETSDRDDVEALEVLFPEEVFVSSKFNRWKRSAKVR